MITERPVCLWGLAVFMWLAPVALAQTVAGTATYRERIALPANAVFEATLEDVSRADAPATVVGRARLDNPGQPPFRFSIPYDPSQITTTRSYAVRARVTAGANLMFTSDQSYPVLTRGAGSQVSILMRRTAGSAGPTQAQAEKSGMFRYLADAANFMDCETRQSVPVAMEGAYKTLEADYLKMRQQPGEELLVTLQGSVMERPDAAADRRVPTLVVDRHTGMWPGETCGTPGATPPLQETYWKLTRVQGKPVIVSPKQREASLTFLKDENAVTGFSGCNELSGTYTLKGNKITFRDFAATLLVCLDDMETENALLPALKAVRSWRISGEHLELYDHKSAMVARFEARALR